MFALLFRFLPDARIKWSDVWIGSFVTAILFVLGQVILAIYLQSGSVGKSFGAASSFVVLLVWIYYSAQIFLFGAEFTQVYANQYGSLVKPTPNAEFVTEEARAQQGAPHKDDRKDAHKDKGKTEKTGRPRLASSPWFK